MIPNHSPDALRLTSAAAARLVEEVARWGAANEETGAFLLCGADRIAYTLALAGEAAVTRSAQIFAVDGSALAPLFRWAEERELTICAQAHSHRGAAFLSPTDRAHGFSVPGFITTVIPSFTNPPPHPFDWGWWIFDGWWRRLRAPDTIDASTDIVHFDARGVHEA